MVLSKLFILREAKWIRVRKSFNRVLIERDRDIMRTREMAV